jgi:hypothetical protein
MEQALAGAVSDSEEDWAGLYAPRAAWSMWA